MNVVLHNSNGDTPTRICSGSTEIVNLNANVVGAAWTVGELDRLMIQGGQTLLTRGEIFFADHPSPLTWADENSVT